MDRATIFKFKSPFCWTTFNLIFIERKTTTKKRIHEFVQLQLMAISCIINICKMFDYQPNNREKKNERVR